MKVRALLPTFIATSSKKFVLPWLLCLLATMPIDSFAQEEEGMQKKIKKEVDFFLDTFRDWAVLSYATYTGQMDAEAASFFSKMLGKYKKRPNLKLLFDKIDLDQIIHSGLDEGSHDFFNKTGIRIYFVGKMVNEPDNSYLSSYNWFLEEKLKNPSLPYIIVRPVLHGPDSSGYKVTVSVEGSPEIKMGKYKLDASDDSNPFHRVTGEFKKRSKMGKAIKEGLLDGLKTLTNEVKENYLPDLMLSFKGDYYKDGEEIEHGAGVDQWVDIKVINKYGQQPEYPTLWTLAPADEMTAKATMTGYELSFPGLKAGNYDITALSGGDEITVRLALQGIDNILKNLLKDLIVEVLTSKKQEAQDTLTVIRQDSVVNSEALRGQITLLEQGNLPMEYTSTVYNPLFPGSREVSEQDSRLFNESIERKRGFELLRKRRGLKDNIREKLNTMAFADLVVDHPDKLKELLDDLLMNSGGLLAGLILGKDSDGQRDSARDIVVKYLNENMERLVGLQYPESSTTVAPLPEYPASPIQTAAYDPNKLFYISPQVEFEGKEEFTTEVKEYLNQLDTPVFVAINYSQDVSTESYLGRTHGSKPKGLPDGHKYLTFTLVNIPGSINYQLLAASDRDVNGVAEANVSVAEAMKGVIEEYGKVSVAGLTGFNVLSNDVVLKNDNVIITNNRKINLVAFNNVITEDTVRFRLTIKPENEDQDIKVPSEGWEKVVSGKWENDFLLPTEGFYILESKVGDKNEKREFWVRAKNYDFACKVCGRDLEVTHEKLKKLFPRSSTVKKNPVINDYFKLAVEKADLNTCYRQAHFFSQIDHESKGMQATEEGSIYSLNRMLTVWKWNSNTETVFYKQSFWDDEGYLDYGGKGLYEKLDDSEDEITKYKPLSDKAFKWKNKEDHKVEIKTGFVKNDEGEYKKHPLTSTQQKDNGKKLLNLVYSNGVGYGNGDVASGDGYKYRGRGAIQLTGKGNYKAISDKCNSLFDTNYNWVSNPDDVKTDLKATVLSASAFIINRLGAISKLDTECKSDNTYDGCVRPVTKLVNGGVVGLDDRKRLFKEMIEGMFNSCKAKKK